MPVDNEWIDRYLARNLSDYNRRMSRGVDPELRSKITYVLSEGVRRINRIPKHDKFWVGTNGEPTIHKLRVYCTELFTSGTADDDARWLAYALDLYHCSSNSGIRYLEPLVEKDISVVCWLIAGARCIYYESDYTPTRGLRLTLQRLSQKVPNFARQLNELKNAPNAFTRKMAAFASQILAGTDPLAREKITSG